MITQRIYALAVASLEPPAPPRRLAVDLEAEDLDDYAARIRGAVGTTTGEAMLDELETAVLRACAGRWSRADLAGWTVTTLVNCLAEHLGVPAAVDRLAAIVEHLTP